MGQEKTLQNPEDEASKDNDTSIKNHPMFKREYVKDKMEAMQKRIDELKEKVKYEGELLHDESLLQADHVLLEKFSDSLDSLHYSSDQQVSESESDKSLYFSASNYSTNSLNTYSSSSYNNLTKLVGSFVKSQDPKERLSLLQLHSKKQIALNMMRQSLSELDKMCAEELELVKQSLRHLNRLAREFNVSISSNNVNEGRRIKALEFHDSNYEESKNLKDQNWHKEGHVNQRVNANYDFSFVTTKQDMTIIKE